MSPLKIIGISSATIATLFLCRYAGIIGEPDIPEANFKNCTNENIAKIRDKERRQEFAGKCVRLSGFAPVPHRTW